MITSTKQQNSAAALSEQPPRYRHARWLIVVPLSIFLFTLVEKYVATDSYNVMHMTFDNRIPFVPIFIVPYTLWYPALFIIGLHHLRRDADAFRRYMWSFGLTYAISIFVYIVYPNGQNMRPNLCGADDIFTQTIAYLHTIDTNTNVFPSIHTTGSLLIIFAVFDSKLTRRVRYIIPAVVFFVLTAVSTVCLKQHSITDIFGGVVVGVVIYLVVYVWIRKIQAKRRKRNAHRAC